ncbi:MAG: hypothetical protein FWF72_02585, partial [Paludibacter sp.]|nr:hypothetical protein [Paludibacter sp.]
MTKKVILMSIFALTISSSAIINAQVGINTENPKATLDIVGKPSNPAIIDGIIAPRLTGKQLAAKDAIYGAEQTGTVVYALDASAAAGTAGAKTTNVTAAGYYYFDGTVWRALQGTSGGGSSSNFNFSYNPTTNVLILEDGTKTETITLGVSASNGLTETNKDIQLGGTLIKNTEIAQNGKNLYTTGSGKVSVGAVPASSSAKFEVNGASANTQAYNAGSGT